MRINITQKELRSFFPNITDSIGRLIPAFFTVKECGDFAVKIGWGSGDIIRIDKRFERLYVVGKKDIRKTTDPFGNVLDTIIFPLGEYENNTMKTIEVKRVEV